MFNKCHEDNSGENDVRRRGNVEELGCGIVFDVAQRMMTYFVSKLRHDDIPHVDRAPYSPQCSRVGRGEERGRGGSAQWLRSELVSKLRSPLTQERSVFQRFAASVTAFTLAQVSRVRFRVVCVPMMKAEREMRTKRCWQKNQRLEELRSGRTRSPIGQESPPAIPKPSLSPSLPRRLPPVPHPPPPSPRNVRSRAKNDK